LKKSSQPRHMDIRTSRQSLDGFSQIDPSWAQRHSAGAGGKVSEISPKPQRAAWLRDLIRRLHTAENHDNQTGVDWVVAGLLCR